MAIFKYAPISDLDSMIQELKNIPLKEENFQKLCLENDTNTIGWYFDDDAYGDLSYRLYLIDGKQPAVMYMTEELGYETERVRMLPHPDGFKITYIGGILSFTGDYQVLSKDSSELYFYNEDDELYRTEYRGEIEYDEFDIGICCQQSFYSMPKK